MVAGEEKAIFCISICEISTTDHREASEMRGLDLRETKVFIGLLVLPDTVQEVFKLLFFGRLDIRYYGQRILFHTWSPDLSRLFQETEAEATQGQTRQVETWGMDHPG